MTIVNWLAIVLLMAVAPVFADSNESIWRASNSWETLFNEAEVRGTAVVFDEGANRWLTNDRARAAYAYAPASTFKVFNAMAALDSNVIKDEYEVLRWDGTKRQFDGWNRDHSLASGMKFSVLWFYQEMARRTGRERMQGFIDEVGYGNRDISGPIDQFWLDNTIRISALQQIEFLRRLAGGTLPFSPRAQEVARRITIIEDAPGWILHAKTGWALRGAADGRTDLGWIIGWLERDGRRWFFAINIDMPKADDAAKRLPLARKLLTTIGAFGRSK